MEENKKSGFQTFLSGLGDLGIPLVSSVANMAVGLLGSKLQKGLVNNHMSGAEREAFNLSAQEAQKARDWNLQMDNTKYQRQVADMQSAGINPALAMNGGVSTQATSNVTANASTQQAPMMSVMDLATSAANLKNLQAQRDLINAQARLANSNADSVDITNKYKDRYELAIVEGQEKANKVTDAKEKEIYKNMQKADAEIKKLLAEAKTEAEKQNLLRAQALLNEANAKQVDALTPVLVELHKAQTEKERAIAAEAFARAAYQQGLIDSGYIEALAREQGFKADEAEAIALKVSGDNAKRGLTDTMSNGEEFYTGKFAKFLGTILYQTADLIGSVLHVGVNYQGNTSDSRSTSTSTNTNTNTSTSTSTSTNWTYHRNN